MGADIPKEQMAQVIEKDGGEMFRPCIFHHIMLSN